MKTTRIVQVAYDGYDLTKKRPPQAVINRNYAEQRQRRGETVRYMGWKAGYGLRFEYEEE